MRQTSPLILTAELREFFWPSVNGGVVVASGFRVWFKISVEFAEMMGEFAEKLLARVRSSIPGGLNPREQEVVKDVIQRYHAHDVPAEHCSSMVAQRVNARVDLVWSVVSRFDKPQTYKHFVRSCSTVKGDGGVGSVREVSLVSGLPATTSTERLELLDPAHHVISFRILGGEHRLRNYHSITTLNEFVDGAAATTWTLVLESYVVGIPEGNTKEDTCMFADTVVRCNLQSLAQVSEHLQQSQERQGVLPALIPHPHRSSSSSG